MNLQYQVRDSVAEILFDVPPVNAITAPLMRELLARLEEARTDPGVRAVIMGSAVPGRFCAGLHLSEMVDASLQQKHALVEMLYQDLFDAQARLGKPSIAAVRGRHERVRRRGLQRASRRIAPGICSSGISCATAPRCIASFGMP